MQYFVNQYDTCLKLCDVIKNSLGFFKYISIYTLFIINEGIYVIDCKYIIRSILKGFSYNPTSYWIVVRFYLYWAKYFLQCVLKMTMGFLPLSH